MFIYSVQRKISTNEPLIVKQNDYFCNRIKTMKYGTKTFEPPEGGISREKHDKQAFGRVGGQRSCNDIQMGY